MTLVAGLTFVFGQILPGEDLNALQVAVGTGVIIALSTGISQALARRGVTWRSLGIQFVAMSVVNIATVIVVGLVVPFRGADQPMVVAVFLVELLTLIVVIYDRFRTIGQVRSAKSGHAD